MCIIINKQKGTEVPSKETIRQCWKSNPHGAGVMYSTGEDVIIKKGFMTLEEFEAYIDSIDNPTDKGIVYHFRITSHGETNQQNTHPFPISKKIEDLKTLDVRTDVGFAHNGIISLTSRDRDITKYGISDTMVFLEKYVSKIFYLSRRELNQDVLDLIDDLGNSKFSILDKHGEIYTLGNFIEDEETGLSFSNTSYKPYVATKYGKYNPKTKAFDYKDWFVIPDHSYESDTYYSSFSKKNYYDNKSLGYARIIDELGLEKYNITVEEINDISKVHEGLSKAELARDLIDLMGYSLEDAIDKQKLVSKITRLTVFEIYALITKAYKYWDKYTYGVS